MQISEGYSVPYSRDPGWLTDARKGARRRLVNRLLDNIPEDKPVMIFMRCAEVDFMSRGGWFDRGVQGKFSIEISDAKTYTYTVPGPPLPPAPPTLKALVRHWWRKLVRRRKP